MCAVARDIVIGLGVPVEPRALGPSRSPPILVLSLSDYISVATQPQESLSIVRVDSNFSLTRLCGSGSSPGLFIM